ncbi:MAG: cytochrome c oxidase accessory protein CcoG [Rhodospirillales bacterium]|nr:cytochrome c oxidase accessory protein CcoG [Rhodospirillales bacterium]MCB9980570.1 cytochrome c oxidase accessory protein CcoG [Rhodospirillales bacterium]
MTAGAPEQDIQLFKKQERIYPRRVSGIYRNLKWIAMIVCLGIYYTTPFIRWDRGPNAPDQAVLIDLSRGRAYWFWFEIWPQEIYILTGVLITAAIGLFLVTSLLGRVWCGYFCFQTVWTDLYIWVERIVQGDRNKRKKLREGPWTFEKIYKMIITHILWLAIGWFTAGSFVLYFNDAPTLVHDFLTFNVSSTVMMFVIGLTLSTYIMAGFAREQVCTFMCPYARFQSAMFDKDTLIIGYDVDRGEPRGKHKKGDSWDGRGHCIDCTACVQVCPMGIDIRHGLQMECIACGLCIDACDDVMTKLDLPKGLIRYDTENRLEACHDGKKPDKLHFIRPRTLYYMAILCVVGGLMLYALVTRTPLELNVLHDRNPLFVHLTGGEIRNGYDIKILNKTHEHRNYALEVEGLEQAKLSIKSAGDVTPDQLYVEADKVGHFHVLVEAPLEPQKPVNIMFRLVDKANGHAVEHESVFMSKRPGAR